MVFQRNETYALKNFEGPIDFLLYLIQKDEIDISDVSIREITQQFLQKLDGWKEGQIDLGAEFISTAAYLVWLKSKSLLPSYDEVELLPEEEREDPNFDVIHHLVDYCRFKEAAKDLSKRHDEQSAYFFRGTGNTIPELKKPLGIDHISLEELSGLFKEMMGRANLAKPKIYEENWRVSDKIKVLRGIFKEVVQCKMADLFSLEGSRLEWIVIFLAILELMKIGEIGVGREIATQLIVIFAKKERESP